MSIEIQSNLPAAKILEQENIFVMTKERASTQDIRPLKILILNIMPTKIQTETQLLRLLGNTPLQLTIEFLQTATHVSRNTSASHLNTFYKTFDVGAHKQGFTTTTALTSICCRKSCPVSSSTRC